MKVLSFLSLIAQLLLVPRAAALFGYGLIRCQFTSEHDVVYLEQIYFNKVLFGQYNSSLGKFIGFTEMAKDIADNLNKDPAFLKQERKNEDKCRSHIPLAFDSLTKTIEPEVRLRSVVAASPTHPSVLVCSAHNFYPKLIKLSWLRDGNVTTADVSFTEEMTNGNWLYQVHSYLEFTPRPGEKISCMVEHASLMRPKLYDWGKIGRDTAASPLITRQKKSQCVLCFQNLCRSLRRRRWRSERRRCCWVWSFSSPGWFSTKRIMVESCCRPFDEVSSNNEEKAEKTGSFYNICFIKHSVTQLVSTMTLFPLKENKTETLCLQTKGT